MEHVTIAGLGTDTQGYPNFVLKSKFSHRGTILYGRTELLSIVGEGSFGRVYKGIDHSTGDHVAIKISRADRTARDCAEYEIEMLKELHRLDPANKMPWVNSLKFLSVNAHFVCVVMPFLPASVFDVIEAEGMLSPYQAQVIVRQLLVFLRFLHGHGLTHGDVKPENLMLHDATLVAHGTLLDPTMRVIDMGIAFFGQCDVKAGTACFMAPEILMGLMWSQSADIWATAATLMQLLTWWTPFEPRNDAQSHFQRQWCETDHVRLWTMEQVLGPIPRKLQARSPDYYRLFNARRNSVHRPRAYAYAGEVLPRFARLEEQIPRRPGYHKYYAALTDFLRKAFDYDQASRITATEALAHPFFNLDRTDFPPK